MIKNIARSFFALWYLLGWMSHVYLAFFNPQLYQGFGATALIPGYRAFWEAVIMPNITIFALALAAFEVTVGLLIIHKGQNVKVGLVLSMLFNLFLVQMGLSMPASTAWGDFLNNRLPNLLLISGQIPLLFVAFDRTLPEMIFKRKQTAGRAPAQS